jgi:hypothetical protein
MRETFVIFKSSYDAIKKLNQEDGYKVLMAVCEYGFNNNIVELDGISSIVFDLIKPVIDSSTKRYDASVENGKKGGAPKGNTNAKKQPELTKEQPKLTQELPNNNLNLNVVIQPENNLNKNKNMNMNKNKNENMNDNMNDNVELEIRDLMKSKKLSRTEAIKYINGLPSVEEIFIKAEEKRKEIFGVSFDDL